MTQQRKQRWTYPTWVKVVYLLNLPVIGALVAIVIHGGAK